MSATGTTARWLAIVWVLSALFVGLICGLSWDRVGQSCQTVSHDGGVTMQEVCSRDVTP